MRTSKPRWGVAALLTLAIAVIGLLVLGLNLIAPEGGSVPVVPGPVKRVEDNTPLIRIEDKVITKFQLDVGRDYHQLRKGSDGWVMPDYGILIERMQLLVNEEILRRNGRGLTPEAIDAERQRQVKETREPGILRGIIELLDRYPGMYEAFMVRPTLANKGMREAYEQHPTLHKESLRLAEEALQQALKDPDFFRVQKEQHPDRFLRMDSRDLPHGHKDNPDNKLPDEIMMRARLPAYEFVKQWLNRTPVGEVRTEVIVSGDSCSVAKLVENKGEGLDQVVIYELIAFPKTTYETWYEAELRKLKGEIIDPQVRREMEEKLVNHPLGKWFFGR